MNMRGKTTNTVTNRSLSPRRSELMPPKLSKYQRVAELLSAEIREGRLTVGQRLESENDLAASFGVSRVTARQALGVLEQEGLIRREAGKGTFVEQARPNGGGGTSSVRQIALVLHKRQLDELDYYALAEIVAAEEWLAERGIAFSLAVVRDEEVMAGKLPPVIANRLCDGLLLDVMGADLQMEVARLAPMPSISAGNHRINPYFSAVRVPVEKCIAESFSILRGRRNQPVAFIGGPVCFEAAVEALDGYLACAKALGQRPLAEVFSGKPTYCERIGADWYDASAEVKHLLDRVDGPVSLITTCATAQSIATAYRALGLSFAEYPVVTIGIPRNALQEDLEEFFVVPFDPVKIVETCLESLLSLLVSGGETIHGEVAYEIFPPGEFDYGRYEAWKVRKGRVDAMVTNGWSK